MWLIIFTLILFIWIGILHHLKNRSGKSEETISKEFWNKERMANDVRRQDISTLSYIHIPLGQLPFQETDDPNLQEYQDTVRQLACQKILNLSGISNTDLKLQYGPSNLDLLTEYDTNYTTLIRTLSNWGQYLYTKEQIHDSRIILEYGIACNTDMKNNYILLAKIYQRNMENDKIAYLIKQAESLNTLMKSSIISSLQTIQNS